MGSGTVPPRCSSAACPTAIHCISVVEQMVLPFMTCAAPLVLVLALVTTIPGEVFDQICFSDYYIYTKFYT